MKGKLSGPYLIQIIYQSLSGIADLATRSKNNGIKLVDCFMSAYAMFSLKYPSLLQFNNDREKCCIRHNLKNLYQVIKTPSDTYMRERLDNVEPKGLRKAYRKLFAVFQRSKFLKLFAFEKDRYLLTLDGTGYFSSTNIHCEHCCEKHHRNGKTSYYHQMLTGALVHPDYKLAIPFPPEPITKQDGATKNDCERNAAKRFLSDFRREHPHLDIIVIEDGLASNAPHIRELDRHKMSYILVAKEKDHRYLFEEFRALAPKEPIEMRRGKTTHRFRWMNGLALNDSNPDCVVNVLEYWEISEKGKTKHWVWVTDILLSKTKVYQIMRGGRARWKIENETFNTLKNQGYHFEHNFGHGHHYLSTVFAYLMLLAFFVDQLQQLGCKTFKKALKQCGSRKNLWEKQRGLFFNFFITSWEDLILSLAYKHQGVPLIPDTS